MDSTILEKLARLGAVEVLKQIQQEREAILALYPDLRMAPPPTPAPTAAPKVYSAQWLKTKATMQARYGTTNPHKAGVLKKAAEVREGLQ